MVFFVGISEPIRRGVLSPTRTPHSAILRFRKHGSPRHADASEYGRNLKQVVQDGKTRCQTDKGSQQYKGKLIALIKIVIIIVILTIDRIDNFS